MSPRDAGAVAGKSVHQRTRRQTVGSDQQLHAVFQAFDSDQSGHIDIDELEGAMKRLGMPAMPREKLQAMIHTVDTDGNGVIDFNEFVAITPFPSVSTV